MSQMPISDTALSSTFSFTEGGRANHLFSRQSSLNAYVGLGWTTNLDTALAAKELMPSAGPPLPPSSGVRGPAVGTCYNVRMTEPQRALLLRLLRHPVVFSGAETDYERLAMLQLYALRCVTHLTSRVKSDAMEWHLTRAGRSKARTLQATT